MCDNWGGGVEKNKIKSTKKPDWNDEDDDKIEEERRERLTWQKMRSEGGVRSVAAAVYEEVGGKTLRSSMSALTF